MVVADVHSLAFTRAATRLADAIGGALADLERALPGAVVVFITIEQAINHRLGLSLTAESEACTAAGAQDESASVPTTTPCCSAAMRTLATDLVRTGQQAVRAPNLVPFRHTHLPNLINECFRWSGCAESPARFNVS